MEIISPNEFFAIWNGEYKHIPAYQKYYSNARGYDEVIFTECAVSVGAIENSFHDMPSLRLVSCNVSNLILEKFKTRFIVLYQCSIQNLFLGNFECDSLNIEYGNSVTISIDKGAKIHTLRLFNKSLTTLNIDKLIGNKLLLDESEVSNVYFSESTVQQLQYKNTNCKSISIKKSSQIEKLKFNDGSIVESLIEDNSKINNVSIVGNSLLKSVSIDNSSLAGGFSVDGKSIIEFFGVYKKSQIGYFNVRGDSAVEFVSIDNSKTGSISFYRSTITYISVSELSHVFGITLEYLTPESKQLTINNSTVETLILTLDKPYQIKVSNNSKIYSLNLDSTIFSKETTVQLSDTALNELKLNSFLNQGVVVFNNITALNDYPKIKTQGEVPEINIEGSYVIEEISKKSTLKFINSDLGRMQFIGCDLRAFDEFFFLNSKMLEVFVADTIFPSKDQIQSEFKINSSSSKTWNLLNQQRLALSQFKKIYENQGDVVKAMEYHADELDAYRATLKEINPKGFNEWCNNKGELLNLWLNRYSSYYGNNWLRAVAWTLVLNSVLFTFYCWALGFKIGTNVSMFWQLASYSPEFLNPLRKADFLSSIACPTNWGRIIDYLSRIIIAYFVYQTIQAFRKYGKKS